ASAHAARPACSWGPRHGVDAQSRTLRAPTHRWTFLPRSASRRGQTARFRFSLGSSVQDFGQHPRRMIARIDAIVDARDGALFIDKKTHARGVLRLGIGAGAKGQRDFPIPIAKQWVFEIIPF